MPITSDKRLDIIKKAVEIQRKVQQAAKETAKEVEAEKEKSAEERK